LPTVNMRTSPATKNPKKKIAKTSPNWFSSVSENACACPGTEATTAPEMAVKVRADAPRRAAPSLAVPGRVTNADPSKEATMQSKAMGRARAMTVV